MNWQNWEEHAQRSFPAIKDHVLLSKASELDHAAAYIKEVISPSKVDDHYGAIMC